MTGTEGTGLTAAQKSKRLDAGGAPFYFASLYAAGIGPLPESYAPYKNKEGKIDYTTDEVTGKKTPFEYSADGDWTVPESKRFGVVAELRNGNLLPSPAVREQDSNGNYTYEYDGGATDAIKREIKAGRAVDFCFAFGTEKDQMQYCDETTWAEYAYDVDAAPDHSCCIVGWDDNYSKTNFKSKDAKGNAVSQPPENGAFLVKNSWGASNNKFPNKFNFGNNGYFWLSYYDPTITMCASYDFNGSKAENKKSSGYYAYGYDYMPVMVVNNDTTDDPAYTANVFTASSSQKIRSLSCQTAAAGDTVTYELYKLNKGYTSPEDGTLMYKTTKTYQYAGYHRIDFSKSCFLSAGDKFSVVITEKDTDNKFVLPVNTAMSKAAGQKTYATSVINKGESYVCSSDTNNVWSDWKNAAAEIVEQAGGTMVC